MLIISNLAELTQVPIDSFPILSEKNETRETLHKIEIMSVGKSIHSRIKGNVYNKSIAFISDENSLMSD